MSPAGRRRAAVGATRRRRTAPTAVAVVVLASACATPAFDRGAYLEDAKAALASATSETRTAELAARVRLGGNATRAYADTVITDSEGALGPIQTSFGGVDPATRRDDALRAQVMGLLGEAEDATAQARIAVRRDDLPALDRARRALADVSERLEQTRDALP